jgi:hypothetical protein
MSWIGSDSTSPNCSYDDCRGSNPTATGLDTELGHEKGKTLVYALLGNTKIGLEGSPF